MSKNQYGRAASTTCSPKQSKTTAPRNKGIAARIIFIGLLFIGLSDVYASGDEERIRGNGDNITSERTVSFFNKIEITKAYNSNNGSDGKGILRVHSSQEYRYRISIDSNLEQYIAIDNKDDILKIETKQKIAEDFIVDIYCPNILGITIDNIARVEFIDNMITPSLEININGGGEIAGAIACDRFTANYNGAGNIDISGSSNEAQVNINGAGNFNGYEFRVKNGIFQINGAGRIECWVIDNMTVDIFGVGNIRYRGEPNIHSRRGGIGSIKKAS